MIISEVLVQPQAITWLPWAVQYFFFIGISACAAIIACVARWIKSSHSAVFERHSLFIALTCGITAPLALTADLHQTARFWHFYAWPTPWSWMPWGALFLPLFTLLTGIWFALFHLRNVTERYTPWMRWVALVTALTAVGLLLYTGREVSVVRARPVWFSYWYPIIMFISAMSALLAFLTMSIRDDSALTRLLAKYQMAILLLLGCIALAWYHGDSLSGVALRQQWQLAIGGQAGMIMAIVMWSVAFTTSFYTSRYSPPVMILLFNVVIVAGLCWLLRWELLIGGQTIPKYNALENHYDLPLGTDGLLAIVGTFGLWFGLMVVVKECINWLTRRLKNA
ncbi:TPA: tetrathionate reductase subunit TtrC [Klebsiella pneumoniae]|jgi:tetrathionate reductase subunit C|uniref:Tetrathionate reductase subunit C n=1 Tax=Klebsiella pneumoniae TaxID=573 RepID=A0AAX2B7R4_KLEPN|nr:MULTISPECIES: tetrathionate reductase subunit TtrC [Klebsiella]EJM8712689.1 tetrathionate reductase subunit TtrC [Klebsiella pneumoniae]EKT8618201.1 tetrathionate reductase subunit TtrC [Klebsiella pneumoniae]EKV0220522.1 tetrathionate reductase subunit TtrC [Klebsiella pneumoniae]EKV4177477.1 tetrathionate reductase subunit TtrC [Klebsiella pneumoniae]ELC0804754.1 tetrathionate reductase subunit TtrC [Klebsiella pneumoniae]